MRSITKRRYHVKALGETIELSLISGVLALISDIAWMAHDVQANGMSLWYGFVLAGLGAALILLLKATLKHHEANVKSLLQGVISDKLRTHKAKKRYVKRCNKQ